MKKIEPTGLLVLFLLIFGKGYGQEGPDPRGAGQYMDYATVKMSESPTASAFNAVGDIQVNPAKGIPNITIPLFTYEVDGVQVPISISYDASGVKVSQMATAVGLGWSLNAGGQISRTVRSKPDEEENHGWFDAGYIRSGYYTGKDPNNVGWQKEMKGHSANHYQSSLVKNSDHNPDMFSYSFLGHSGSYIHNTLGTMIKEKNDGISLVPFGNTDDDLQAYDLEGNHFFFNNGDTETSSNVNVFHTFDDLILDFYEYEKVNGLPITTAWKLSNITTKNGKEIQFKYESVDMEYTFDNESFSLTVGRSCSVNQNGKIESKAATDITYKFSTQLLTEISSPDSDLKVVFEYAQDTGLPVSVWNRKLIKIKIIHIPSAITREFHFDYGRFPGDPRLKLERVREVAYKNGILQSKPPHEFEYHSGSLPPKDSKGQDLYGYYNGNDNNSTLVPNFMEVGWEFQGFFDDHAGDRSLNVNRLKRGVLTKITYPTGGKTLFDYDPNVEDFNPLSGYRGGLRIKEIKNLDEYDSVFNRKTYQYNDLRGIDLKAGVYQWFMKTEGRSRSFFGHPTRLPGDYQSGYKTGYYYGKVTVLSHSDPATENFKMEFKYNENLHNSQRYDFVLQSETMFKGVSSSPLKIVEYENGIISPSGNAEVLDWYVVGDMDCYDPPTQDSHIGHTINPRLLQFSGNYTYLPTKIATTEFLDNGSGLTPVTTLREISYHPETLLKTKEVTDLRYTRVEDQNEGIHYQLNDSNAERIVVDYTYPFDLGASNPDLPQNFPKGTVLKQEVRTTKAGQTIQTGGEAYVFDAFGNIKTIYKFNKEVGSNNPGVSYVPSSYEEGINILYVNGKPVEVKQKNGVATTYIWGKKGDFPLAKIEGVSRVSINQNTITAAENADYNALPSALSTLRADVAVQTGMVTTFTHKPLAGVETATDPKGETVTYEYDEFGRLVLVRDNEGKIISETQYNYSGI